MLNTSKSSRDLDLTLVQLVKLEVTFGHYEERERGGGGGWQSHLKNFANG